MRRTRRGRRFGEAPTLMLTSMTDMFTLVLMFLLNFVDPSMSSDSSVRLPTAAVSGEASKALTLTITQEQVRVGESDVVALDGTGHLPAGVERDGQTIVPLYDALGRALDTAAKSKDEPTLRVECDKAVPYALLADALYTAGQAGFARYQFVVIQGSK